MNSQEPLGLPRGSVRAIIAILVALSMPVVMTLAAFGYGIPTELMAFYTAVVMLVLRDYFGSRQVATVVEEVRAEEDTSYAKDA